MSIVFYQIFQTEGRLKENAIICPIMDFVGLGIVYVVYLMEGSVLAIAWAMLILTILQGMVVKPWLAVRMFNFRWYDFLDVYWNNLKVIFASLIVPLLIYYTNQHTVMINILLIIVSILTVLLSTYYIGMTAEERAKIMGLVMSKIRR